MLVEILILTYRYVYVYVYKRKPLQKEIKVKLNDIIDWETSKKKNPSYIINHCVRLNQNESFSILMSRLQFELKLNKFLIDDKIETEETRKNQKQINIICVYAMHMWNSIFIDVLLMI